MKQSLPATKKVIDTYNLTNRYTPEQTDLTVVKAWDDADNQDGIRPEKVTVALVADGKDRTKRPHSCEQVDTSMDELTEVQQRCGN